MGYDDDELLKNTSPSEDDDDDFDVDLLDDIEDEVEADNAIKNNNTQQQSSPHQTPFGTNPGGSSPWSTNNGSNNTWKPTYTPPQQPTTFPGPTWSGFGNNQGQPQQGNTWGSWNNNGSTWNNGYRPGGNTWTPTSWTTNSPAAGNRKTLPRQKKIILCDLLDNVIEPLSAQGRPGVQPQGIYDMRIKFEVLDRFRAINPEYLFILTNQNFTPGTPAGTVYKAMIDYLVFSIAEYMRIPYENVKCITKTGYNIQDPNVKPNTGLIQIALKTIPDVKTRFKKEDILVCGSASGLAGQGNRDIEMARKFGVDYIDIQELLNYYT